MEINETNEVFETNEIDEVDEVKEVKEEQEVVAEENTETTEIDQLKEQLNQKENEAKTYLDKLQRTMAEYDNFRKRTIKEKAAQYDMGAKDVLEKMLPIVDNFSRALDSITEEEKDSSLAKGIEMIYKQLMGTLKDLGVEEIEALGKEFDPNLHHAMAHEENEAYGDNEVIEVLQPGYMYKDRVLRCSLVKVAN